MQPFDVAALPLFGTSLVEASAGTGKTHALSTLFVRLLLERGLTVERILVLTFTEAATLELKDRIRRRLSDALGACESEAPDPELSRLVRACGGANRELSVRRLRRALENIDEASIQTIHGFCQRVLRDHAFETGAPFESELLLDDSSLKEEVIADFWAKELTNAEPSVVELVAASKLLPSKCAALADLIGRHPGIRLAGSLESPSPEIGRGNGDGAEIVRGFRRRLIEFLRSELPRRKASLGVVSFDDLLEQLHTALRGPHGPVLARSLRERFPAALIDEFQDTDPTQYAIFRAIYRSEAAEDCALFLIGDPKQAIYGFRGADIFAYLMAAGETDAARRFTLTTNYRSDPGLVRALGQLFSRLERPFLLPSITHPEISANRQQGLLLDAQGAPLAPLEFLFVPRGEDGKALAKEQANKIVCQGIAREICEFLQSHATIDGRAVRASDVAVLTRTNQQAFELRTALSDLGVQSVVLGDQSVFERPEAHELVLLLRAVADPNDEMAIRAALTTELVGVTASDLDAMDRDETLWEDWLDDFRSWHELWVQRGFVQMFRRFLDGRGIRGRLLARRDGERRMTNFLHLMELLHSASHASDLGPSGLVHWLEQRRAAQPSDQTRSEAVQVRLESDDSAVKLLTVHRSKGLEFGIVYCPYLWHASLLSQHEHGCFAAHDPASHDELTLSFDSGSAEHARLKAICEWELHAESLRLLYVALTRAKHRSVVVWGALSRDYYKSALWYLLCWPPGSPVPERGAAPPFLNLAEDDRQLLEGLRARTREASDVICIRELPASRAPAGAFERAAEPRLRHRELPSGFALADTYRTTSFSAFVSVKSRPSLALDEEGRDRDELDALSPNPPPAHDLPRPGLDDLPKGARAGNFFHEILEELDFTRNDFEPLIEKKLLTYGYHPKLRDPVAALLGAVLQTPLSRAAGAFSLRDIGPRERLNELEFYLPIGGASGAGSDLHNTRLTLLTRERLALAFSRFPSAEMPSSYAERLRRLSFLPVEGYLKGYIDLIFRRGERWFVADYKTNHLGSSLRAYSPARLATTMANSHYFLQYHLYTLALHRYLERRLPGYSYARHFGGVYYLFLKGMTPETGPDNGVFFERPPFERIELLSAAFSDPAGIEEAANG